METAAFTKNLKIAPQPEAATGVHSPMFLSGDQIIPYHASLTRPMEEIPARDSVHPDPETAIDHALMAQIATGDERAFRMLVERHQDAIVGTCTKMLGNTTDSEDIAQQVFIRVWKHAKKYKPDNKFTTYLYTITRNLVYNETRRRSRKKTVSTDQREDESHLQHPGDPNAQPDASLLTGELQAAIDAAIQSLPENQRLAVVLRRYDNLPYEEIADILGTSVSSVKSILFRARTTLRETLAKYLDE